MIKNSPKTLYYIQRKKLQNIHKAIFQDKEGNEQSQETALFLIWKMQTKSKFEISSYPNQSGKISKSTKTKCWREHLGKGIPHSLLIGLQTDANILEITV